MYRDIIYDCASNNACNICDRTLLTVLWLLRLVPWLQVPISGDEENSNCWPTSPTPQQVQKGMHFPCRMEDQGVNQIEGSQRGVFCNDFTSRVSSCNQVPTTCPQGEAQTQPSPPNALVKLRQIVKKKVHMLYKKACTHYRHILKGTQLCYTKGNSTSDVRCMQFLWHWGSLSPAK